jgi:nucleoside-diphosphate-sugar epimerase
MTEDWPTRPADKLFYAQEKAELEQLLHDEAAKHPELALYLLRPPVVLGPHTVGAKEFLPGPLAPLSRRLQGRLPKLPVPIPAVVPDIPLQFVHEDDVGQALLQCVVAAGPPGAYNIAGDGVITAADVARELGFLPVPLPPKPVYAAARAAAKLPLPSFVQWIEAFSHPAVMATSRAKNELGWKPKFSSVEALRATLRE